MADHCARSLPANLLWRSWGFLISWLTCALLLGTVTAGETLYNGIVLPDAWPPRPEGFSREPAPPPPYLTQPPAVIPIDVGRQLLVDDFPIEQSTLQRVFHLPTWYEKSPVFQAQQEFEERNGNPFAAPFSDGVWYDPQDGLIKMWYMAGNGFGFGYATSRDGLQWTRPALQDAFFPGTNLLRIEPFSRDSSTVWLDLEETDPARRFKLLYYRAGLQTRFSPDGIRWSEVVVSNREAGDRTTMFYNPFRKVWVYSVRGGANPVGRARFYAEAKDLGVKGWEQWEELSRWTSADDLDHVRSGPFEGKLPDLYNVDATPYESLLVGFFNIHSKVAEGDRPKINHVTLGYSRDGFHWHRPDRRAFLNVSEDKQAWNYGNVQPAGGGCLVMGDKLYFYCSGRNSRKAEDDGTGGSTGLAILRRDGFASLTAGTEPGTLTTRPVRFAGRALFVNADCDAGELRAEVLDDQGQVIAPFSRENCRPVKTDSTLQAIRWEGAADLSAVAGKPVRLRFTLRQGQLFSFWVSPDETGASYGYVAAGGPGFVSNRDTVGAGAYTAVQKRSQD